MKFEGMKGELLKKPCCRVGGAGNEDNVANVSPSSTRSGEGLTPQTSGSLYLHDGNMALINFLMPNSKFACMQLAQDVFEFFF